MYSESSETALLVIVGVNTVAGIVTTVVIIILSFTYFKSM